MHAPVHVETILSARRWLHHWNTPGLVDRATIQWSSRMTRSLGRCYPERRLIRIATFVRDSGNELLEEVLCHELAHLAARELHGQDIRPHGPEWRALMRAAGYDPKTRLPAPPNAPPPPRRRRRRKRRFLYLHRCPRCRRSRPSLRVVRRWRCAVCLAAGLSGALDVLRRAL